MNDLLVGLSGSPMARRVIRLLRLPIPLPPPLRRAKGPWEERSLQDLPIVVCHGRGGVLADPLAQTLVAAGAEIWAHGEDFPAEVYADRGEAWGRSPRSLPEGCPAEGLKPHGLLFDATGLRDAEDLRQVYDFFHPWVRPLRACGRIVILCRPSGPGQLPELSAVRRAIDGFAKSVGREVGRKGATVQTVAVEEGAEDRLEPVLRFLLSYRAAYISGQSLRLSCQVGWDGAAPRTRPLDGKVALITGAGRGIGAATARAMAREGAQVIAMDLPSDQALILALAQEIQGIPLACDITADDAPQVIAKAVEERFGRLDIVVHNAGITRDKTLANMDAGKWDQVLRVNLVSILRANETLFPIMAQAGRMVLLSSVGGIAGNVGQANYAATKAGVIGYIQALAPLLASQSVAVNAVAPGFIETRLTAAIPVGTRFMARRLSNLSQGGLPQDVAEAILFLASPGAAGMCGEVLRVCGGSFIGA